MDLSAPLILSLVVAIIATMFAISIKSWLGTILLSVLAFGSTVVASSALSLDVGWSSLIIVILFLVIGLTTVRNKDKGSLIVGMIYVFIGIVLLVPTFQSLGTTTPGTILDSLVQYFQQGWVVVVDRFQQVFGGT